MPEVLATPIDAMPFLAGLFSSLSTAGNVVLIILGFSLVVFFHELGHFLVAKWGGIRVERFAVGFGSELFGFTRGETRYSFNVLPLGGYVKMMGQEDFEVDSTGELAHSDDPRSFANKPVGIRMAVVSAGVVMNLIFAVLLFMVVYMVGKQEVEPIVGQVVSDSPAARAGLQVGDRVRSINDMPINSFDQISVAVRLSTPLEPLRFEIEREGQVLAKSIVPRRSELNFLQVGIAPAETAQINGVSPEYLKTDGPIPKPGDRIIEVNGQPIDESLRLYIWDLMLHGRNRPCTLVLQRPQAGQPDGPGERVTVNVEKKIDFSPNGVRRTDPRDLLGLIPRVKVSEIRPKQAAALAGLKEGDIIVRWAGQPHPTAKFIHDTILEKAGRDIPVMVRRGDEFLPGPLYYRAQVILSKDGKPKAQPGCRFVLSEQRRLVLAGVHAEAFGKPMPAAATDLTAGCRITEVDAAPVRGWAELAECFRRNAGRTVEITYYPPASTEKKTTAMAVPQSLSTILDLPSYSSPYQRINFTLDGKTDIRVNLQDKTFDLPAHHWLAIREYLSEKVGHPVKVAYADDSGSMVTKTITVTEDMVDPWYRRVAYSVPLLRTKEVTYVYQHKNPLAAIWAGATQTYYFVAKTYLTLQRLIFTRSVGVESMSGPLGIISIGAQIAGLSKIDMLYFLALISANLAVLNFLPLPIVDGGLMVFLFVEKIKGSPVSIRTQVITQMIGLALFATMFVLITFQDLAKMLG